MEFLLRSKVVVGGLGLVEDLVGSSRGVLDIGTQFYLSSRLCHLYENECIMCGSCVLFVTSSWGNLSNESLEEDLSSGDIVISVDDIGIGASIEALESIALHLLSIGGVQGGGLSSFCHT